jgi:dTDP-4-amino-4,6-dideoxygalactose transaminase
MELLMELSNQNGFIVVEDAAQCIGAKYSNDLTSTFIGTRAHLSAFSFHDTKNLHCGEGGLLIINDEQFVNRAEIIKDKGTNRGQFNRGEIDKYTWVDIGSSYLPGEYNMAVLLAQLQEWEIITSARQEFWNLYNGIFGSLNDYLPPQSAGNGHNYYLTFKSANQRDDFANRMNFARSAAVIILPVSSCNLETTNKEFREVHVGRVRYGVSSSIFVESNISSSAMMDRNACSVICYSAN